MRMYLFIFLLKSLEWFSPEENLNQFYQTLWIFYCDPVLFVLLFLCLGHWHCSWLRNYGHCFNFLNFNLKCLFLLLFRWRRIYSEPYWFSRACGFFQWGKQLNSFVVLIIYGVCSIIYILYLGCISFDIFHVNVQAFEVVCWPHFGQTPSKSPKGMY